MICCIECFKDSELKSIISSVGKKGDCSICGRKDMYIYDTDIDEYLIEYFDELLDVYTCKNVMPKAYPPSLYNTISEELINRWGIFNIEVGKVNELIREICKEKYQSNQELFTDEVGILELGDSNYLNNNCILKTYDWDTFKYSLTNVNRFYSDQINVDVMDKLCKNICVECKAGTILYRARISDEKGFIDKKQMLAPPPDLSNAGRANSTGISCLYLADNIDTTIHEIRARHLDYISIASFQLKYDLKIIDLSYLDGLSAFSIGFDLTWFAANIDHLKKIANEIAKPLRRQDSVLDYLPTQYISDFVKHAGYDGIKYKSTLSSGNNFAIFDQKNAKINEIKLYHIDNLIYKYSEVKK